MFPQETPITAVTVSSRFLLLNLCIIWVSASAFGNSETGFLVNSNGMQRAKNVAKRAWNTIEKIPTASAPFDVFRLFMDDEGTYPNNPDYPVLLYKSAFLGTRREGERAITDGGTWTSPWAWGVFPYHHYHTTAWELLLCVQGEADVQMGGGSGPIVQITKGDLVLIPPGVAHKQLRDSGGFTLLGSYPRSDCPSGNIDTVRGAPTQKQRDNIVACPVPDLDPIFRLDIHRLSNAQSSVQ